MHAWLTFFRGRCHVRKHIDDDGGFTGVRPLRLALVRWNALLIEGEQHPGPYEPGGIRVVGSMLRNERRRQNRCAEHRGKRRQFGTHCRNLPQQKFQGMVVDLL